MNSHLNSLELKCFLPINYQKLFHRMNATSQDMIGCDIDDLTPNLISNASMETFPGNKLSNFTTPLPTRLTLVGDWQVTLLEISWPAMVRNVTEGKTTVSETCQTHKWHCKQWAIISPADDQGWSQWECRRNFEKNQHWILAHQKYVTERQVVIHPLKISRMRSWKVLRETTRKTIYHQPTGGVWKQSAHQEKFRGKLRKRRKNLT